MNQQTNLALRNQLMMNTPVYQSNPYYNINPSVQYPAMYNPMGSMQFNSNQLMPLSVYPPSQLITDNTLYDSNVLTSSSVIDQINSFQPNISQIISQSDDQIIPIPTDAT
jgi:hypothetical protein